MYGLYDTKSRIDYLETLLCHLSKEDKPIDNCLIALKHLRSTLDENVEKPQKTKLQIIGDLLYNGFAIFGMLLFTISVIKASQTCSYTPMDIVPTSGQAEVKLTD